MAPAMQSGAGGQGAATLPRESLLRVRNIPLDCGLTE